MIVLIILVVGWLGVGNLLWFTVLAVRCPKCRHHVGVQGILHNPFWATKNCTACGAELP